MHLSDTKKDLQNKNYQMMESIDFRYINDQNGPRSDFVYFTNWVQQRFYVQWRFTVYGLKYFFKKREQDSIPILWLKQYSQEKKRRCHFM